MALDKTTLAATLKDTFQKAKDQQWTSDQVADALAGAIDAYVRGAAVVGVKVDVNDTGNNPIGTGTQNGTGSLQ